MQLRQVFRKSENLLLMFVAIAGHIGAGKSTIAKQVSTIFGIPHVALDQFKIDLSKNNHRYQYCWDNNIPLPDVLRAEVYREVSINLEFLAKTHCHVIVDETFHKEKFRKPFFVLGKELFSGFVLTLVEATDEIVRERLDIRTSGGKHIVGYGMHLAFKPTYEPFEEIDFIYNNNGPLTETLPHYCKFLQELLV